MSQPLPFSFAPFRWTLIFLFLGLVFVGFFTILLPFLKPIAWSVIVTVASWPLYVRLRNRFPTPPRLAPMIMTLLITLVVAGIVGPILFGLSKEVDGAVEAAKNLTSEGAIHLPTDRIPYIGHNMREEIDRFLNDKEAVAETFSSFRNQILSFLKFAAKGVLSAVLTCFLTIFISYFFFRSGESLIHQLREVFIQVGGHRMEELLHTTHATLIGSVYGMLMTAIVQGVLAGAGFAVAGAPVPLLLGFATVIAALVPFGPPFIYVPASIMLIAQGNPVSGILLLAWGLGVVSFVDNLLRPYFLSQSTQMPILLSVMGVLGGLVTFGLIGLFIGPVLVALVLVLWREWTVQSRLQPEVGKLSDFGERSSTKGATESS